MEELNKCFSIKFIIIGNSGVGKTNIVYRFINGEFEHDLQNTIGLEFSTKDIQINNVIFHISVYDTAGSDPYQSLRQNYYNNAACAIIVYDITDEKSFNAIDKWIEECEYSHNQDLIKILVGNKVDLNKEGKRKVSEEEGIELANRYGINFYETSALNGHNIQKIFYDSCNKAYQLIEKNINEDENQIIKGISKYTGDIKTDLTVINNEVEIARNDKGSCCFH